MISRIVATSLFNRFSQGEMPFTIKCHGSDEFTIEANTREVAYKIGDFLRTLGYKAEILERPFYYRIS